MSQHTIVVFIKVASLLKLTQYRLLIDLREVKKLLLRGNAHLEAMMHSCIHRGLLKGGLIRVATHVVFGELRQRNSKWPRDVGFNLLQIRVLKHGSL